MCAIAFRLHSIRAPDIRHTSAKIILNRHKLIILSNRPGPLAADPGGRVIADLHHAIVNNRLRALSPEPETKFSPGEIPSTPSTPPWLMPAADRRMRPTHWPLSISSRQHPVDVPRPEPLPWR
jgi:hypothetical protein